MGLYKYTDQAGEFCRTKAINARLAFTSWDAFKAWIEAPKTQLDAHGRPIDAKRGDFRWSNEDLDPTPPAKRTWTWVNYVIFYWGLSFGNWTLGSTMVGIGLNWWESILVIFASQLISSIAMFFNSRCASVYHIGYPVVARSVFGMWGSFYVVAARAMLAIICALQPAGRGEKENHSESSGLADGAPWPCRVRCSAVLRRQLCQRHAALRFRRSLLGHP